MNNRGQIKWDVIRREHMLKYTPIEGYTDELKQQEEGWRNKRVFTKYRRKGQAGGARQTLTHVHVGGVLLNTAAPQHHPTVPPAGQALGKHVSAEWKLNVVVLMLMMRKSRRDVWGGRQRATATLHGENGNQKKQTETVEKHKVRSSSPMLLHCSLHTVHSVLTLDIACKIIH